MREIKDFTDLCAFLQGREHMITKTRKGVSGMKRMEELLNESKIKELLHKREQEEKTKNNILWLLAIIGAVAAVAAIAYGVYRFFTPDYLEDFEDDFEDDLDDDFFEEEEVKEEPAKEETAEE